MESQTERVNFLRSAADDRMRELHAGNVAGTLEEVVTALYEIAFQLALANDSRGR
jgi:hypothetical protein